ncbi:hybrid sensor histidine kinase/response regulator [Desulfobulbus alkaliphilus]|uniref:hybrid sensor histidine kinase/response regulator n=1 Tax=Desulfobulbus alkaliphilus TaxID=869814 RepID=UPI001963A18A|nr:response regulator [Desulfobulbus alkaliphilus]MBM9538276.1 response regulator [Desulfobulbus alkaliphilus]
MSDMADATLLIVEDDAILAVHLEATVHNLGYKVLGPTATGEEAMALLHTHQADLVLMDIELAGPLNGIETAAMIAGFTDIPVIFVTGFSHELLLKQAKTAAPYGYLVKPVNERELAAAITMTLHRHRLDRELKQSRKALAISESRYRLLFENSPLGIFRTTIEGTILLANQEMAALLGYASPREAIEQCTDLARQVYVDPNQRQEFIDQLRHHGEVRLFTCQWRQKNGAPIWVAMNARLSAVDDPRGNGVEQVIDGFAQDITERKLAEQALQESEQRHRQYLLSTPYGVFAVDAAGHYLQVNPSACHLTGYTEYELLAMTIADLHFENDWPTIRKKLRQVNHHGSFSGDLPFRHKDGTRRWFNLTAVKISDDRFLGFCNDITERKQAEAENKHLQAQLLQAQKLEAIGTLAGGIAHDFNNILAAVIGYADMARDNVISDTPMARDLNHILKAGHRAKDLVKQILTFSRQADNEPSVFYPAFIAREAVKLLRPSLPATIAITTDIEAKAGPVLIDPTQFHQVVMNLCTNAFHAMEENGGTLDLSLTTVRIDNGPLMDTLSAQSGDYVRLTVRDTGNGMPPEVRDRIFDPFFTTKEASKGTGMGLAIVHGIITGSGGFITLDSSPGQGTTFQVHLPLVEVQPETVNESTAVVTGGTERILFIDDEEILAEMTTEMLARLGYQVTVQTSSLAALTTFESQPDQFDLVITDQTMPGMTGTELARRMLRIRPNLPIILCTGYSTQVSEEKAKALGIRAFLFKPLGRKDLARLIRQVLDTP